MILAAAFLHLLLPLVYANGSSCPEPENIRFKISKAIHRSEPAFTEGLVYHSGTLFESTGHYGRSTVNKVDPSTGKTTVLLRLPESVFGEGLDYWQDTFMQLTWKENIAYFWNIGLAPSPAVREYPREGWGLTHDSDAWIASDGTAFLHFLDPTDLTEMHSLQVRSGSSPQARLNELEYLEGKVFANVFTTSRIVRIDPRSGCVDGVLELSPLNAFFTAEESARMREDQNTVANGIAYDKVGKVLYVTGKNWPLIFQLKLLKKDRRP